MIRNFQLMVERHWAEGRLICIGLDSDLDNIPNAARRSGVYRTLTLRPR